MVAKKQSLDYITNRLDIDTLCRALHIPVPQGGRNISCPLGTHEDKSPSFTLDDKKGKVLYHCKSCQAGGDAIDLIMKMSNLDKGTKDDFLEGVRKAAEIAGIPLEDDKEGNPIIPKEGIKSSKAPKKEEKGESFQSIIDRQRTTDPNDIERIQNQYLQKKGIDLKKIEGAVYLKTGTFAFPMYNETNKICGYQTGSKVIIKNSKVGCFVGTLNPEEDIYMVEGLSDYLSMIHAGFKNTIGLCSVTTPSKALEGVVSHFYFGFGGEGSINICFDYDGIDGNGVRRHQSEGFAGAKKAADVAARFDRYSQVFFASKVDKRDINDFLQEGGKSAIESVFRIKEDILELEDQIGDREKKAKAPIIANRIAKSEILASENGNLWRYEKGVWTKMLRNEPEKFIKDFIRSNMHTMPTNSLITQTRDHVMYDASVRGRGLLDALSRGEEYFIKNNGIIFLEDCKYNVLTGEKFIYTPEDYVVSTLSGDSHFDGAACPRFMEFLNQIFEGDYDIKDRILYMQELFGYCMYPQVPQEKLFAWIGKGGNGKGTLMETLSFMLGPKNRKNMEISRLDKNDFALSQLIGIYLNSCSEERRGVPLGSPMIKQLTGGDTITTDRKFSTDLDFKPFCKVIISLNDAPSVSEDADWLARRLMMLWFNNNFDNWQQGRRGDPNLKSNLKKEVVGIRAWAIQGLRRLLTNGKFTEPASMREQTISFLQRHDRILQFFRRVVLPQVNISKTKFGFHDLYMQYRNYHESYTASTRGTYHFETFVQRMCDVTSGVAIPNFIANEITFDWGKFKKIYMDAISPEKAGASAIENNGFTF